MRNGIDRLIPEHSGHLAGRRTALVSHMAAVAGNGQTSAELLWNSPSVDLVALFGPEHGYDIKAGPGVACRTRRHPKWKIPVYSLYGETKMPTAHMLKGIQLLVIDFQDLALRCYTYVSTLRLVLEAAAEHGIPVVVADRPVPLPNTIDGPITRSDCESFVSMIPAPMCYAMTPGETAGWLNDELGLHLDLQVAKMKGYRREPLDDETSPLLVPPSPAIRSWHIAQCYPVTVFAEALPSLDHGRLGSTPFETLSADWIKPDELCDRLRAERLRGIAFSPNEPDSPSGIRLRITKPSALRPILASVIILQCLQELYGKRRLWRGARGGFFDKLYGTTTVRATLLDGLSARDISSSWNSESARFRQSRSRHLLYRGKAG